MDLSGEGFVKPWYLKNFKIPGGAVQSSVGQQVFLGISMVNEKVEAPPGPGQILKCLYEGLTSLDQAVNLDARSFAELQFVAKPRI